MSTAVVHIYLRDQIMYLTKWSTHNAILTREWYELLNVGIYLSKFIEGTNKQSLYLNSNFKCFLMSSWNKIFFFYIKNVKL